ncbi:MAG: DUF2191 domain-containing protein [Proteobacteria bacterium]|nr:DUF2191 domain-containing protein [Burkholderiales bacterium]
MRTTLSLDKDVAAQLARLRRSSDANFKGLINEALRRGLRELEGKAPRKSSFETSAVSLGRCKLGDVDNISDVLAAAEGESFK